MEKEIGNILGERIKDGAVVSSMTERILDLVFNGKENHFTIASEKFKKMPVEGGHIYFFWNFDINDWNSDGIFVSKMT